MAFINISKTNLKKRLFAIAGICVVLQLAVAIVSINRAKALLGHVAHLSDIQLPATRLSMEADMFHDGLSAKVYQSLYYREVRDLENLKRIKQETVEMADSFVGNIDQLYKLPISESARAHIRSLQSVVQDYGDDAKNVVEMALSGDASRVSQHRKKFDQDFKTLEAGLDQLGDILVGEGKNSTDSGGEIVETVGMAAVITLLVSVLVSALIYVDTRRIFEKAAQSASKIASTLESSARGVEDQASKVKEASIEQAAAIQESVSALTEMGSMIAQTSQNVALSRESSDATRALAENGKQTMERLAHSLSAIQKSNTQLQELQKVIEDINSKTAVINDIVFKTQLLSFNASIEAARAGQHGRGFAVVAEEVGSLADMSGQAARDITTLLEASQNKVRETLEMIQARVQDGNKVGQLAIRAFDEISEGVAQINAQVRAIGEATQQQEIGVQQTNTAMRQMDVTSQSNAEASTVTLSQAGSMSMDCVSLNAALSDLLSLIGAIPPSSAAKLAAPKSTVGVTRMSAPSSSDDLEDLATKVVAMSRGGGASKKNARDLPSADHPSFKKAG